MPIRVVAVAAEALPAADASVDAVVASLVLCSVADPDQALAEVRRVLRPGGKLRFYDRGCLTSLSVMRWASISRRPLAGRFRA